MKCVYVNNLTDQVQQGMSFTLESIDGSIGVGSKVDHSRLWRDLPKTKKQRSVAGMCIEDFVIYLSITGPTIKTLT